MQTCLILQIRMVGFVQQLSRAQSVCEEENGFVSAVTCDGKGDDDGLKGDARGDWLGWALNIAEGQATTGRACQA